MIQFSQDEELTKSRESVDLTPMIDMVFILLVFFLLTSAVMLPAITVNLPEAETGEDKTEIELTVTMKSSGTILINDNPVQKNNIPGKLQEMQKQKTITEVFIESDEAIPFGDVIGVTDLIRQAGVTSISFIVEPN